MQNYQTPNARDMTLFQRDRSYPPKILTNEYTRQDMSVVRVGDIIEYANTKGNMVKGTVDMILPHAAFGEGMAIVNTERGKEYVNIEALNIIETKSTPPTQVEEFEADINIIQEKPQDASEAELAKKLEDENTTPPEIEIPPAKKEEPPIKLPPQTLTPEEQEELIRSMKLDKDWDTEETPQESPIAEPEKTSLPVPENPIETVSPPISEPKIPKTKEPLLSQAELDALLAGMNMENEDEPDIETTLPETKPTSIPEAPQEIESVLSPETSEPETEEVLPHAKFENENELIIYQNDGTELLVSTGDTVEYIPKNNKKQIYTIIKINPKLHNIQLQNTQKKGFVFAIGENNLIDEKRFKKTEEEPEPITPETTEETPEVVIPGQGEELIAIEETPIEEITEKREEPTDWEKLSSLLENYDDTSVIIGGDATSPEIEKNESTGTLTFRYGEKQYITFFVENEIIKAKYSIKGITPKEKIALQKGINETNLSGLLKAIQGEFRETWERDQAGPRPVFERTAEKINPFQKEIEEKSDAINLLQKYDLTEDDTQKLRAYYDFLSGDNIKNPDLRAALQLNWEIIDALKSKIKTKLNGTDFETIEGEDEEAMDEQTDEISGEPEEEKVEKRDDHPIKNILRHWIPGEQVLFLSQKIGHEIKTSFAIENAPPCELEETEKGIRFFYNDDFALEITSQNDTIIIEYFINNESKKRITITNQKKKNVIEHIFFFKDMARKLYTGREPATTLEKDKQNEYEEELKKVYDKIINAELKQHVFLDPEQQFDDEYIEVYLSELFFNTLRQVLQGHANIPNIFIADRTEAETMGEEKIKITEENQGKIITINPTQTGWPGELSQYLIQNP